jgi:hypothetical protein
MRTSIVVFALLLSACGRSTSGPLSPSDTPGFSTDVKRGGDRQAVDRQTIYIYSYEVDGRFVIGQPVVFSSSAGTETALTTNPHGDAAASIPRGEAFSITVNRDGFCPVARTLAADAPSADRWIRLMSGC